MYHLRFPVLHRKLNSREKKVVCTQQNKTLKTSEERKSVFSGFCFMSVLLRLMRANVGGNNGMQRLAENTQVKEGGQGTPVPDPPGRGLQVVPLPP